jgi:glycosyltransferase involved in cell wall biosynthesis
MKVSIITVCYNAAAVIEGCLRSVAGQTYQNIEHIVIDGLSDDATIGIVQRYPHVAALVSEPDRGIYDAMNKGLDRVTGDYVLFLNADDMFNSSDSIEKAVSAIEHDPGGDVYYGSLEVRPLDGPAHVFTPPPPAEAPGFMICGCLPHQSTFARPSVFARTGRFDLSYRFHADYDWFLKVLANPAIDVRLLNEVIGSFQMGGASSQLERGQPEVFRIQNGSPLYATPEWDKKRIDALQDAWLQERLAASRLSNELHAVRNLSGKPERAAAPRSGAVASWSVAGRIVSEQLVSVVHSRLRRLRWWTLETCVRLLPDGAVQILRRVRAGWRVT